MIMPTRKYTQAGSKYGYGFNGKENDNEVKGEGNQQDYGFRIYDPRLAKFLSVDPLTKSYPWYSPYQFAGNKPIAATDLDGLEELWITNNCFAPFDLFGSDLFGSFSGDGEKRKFGDGGTYRTSGKAHINLRTAEKPNYVPGTSTSTYHRKNSSGRDKYVTESKSRIQDEYYYSSPDKNYHHLQMHVAGSNKASIFGSFVDIDNHVNIYFEKNPEDKSKVLVHGSVQGDRFPANETILNDKNGNQLILGVSSHNGPNKDLGPYVNLPGDNKRNMQEFSMTILFSKDDTFKGVEFGGKQYSIVEWNKQFTKLDPKVQEVSTKTKDNGTIQTKKSD
jgi:RHS repeat-associated protein